MNVSTPCVMNTFKYIYHKYKKGIFVKIMDNKLNVFLPFSKANYKNEWSSHIKISPKYRRLSEFIRHISDMEGRRFNERNINTIISQWYANNGLVRYEYPLKESETNVSIMKNMLEELCESREIPDIEFYINRRDFPLLTKGGYEAYNNMWDNEKRPLVSHNYDKYLPILSMCKTNMYADVLMPTSDDWARVQCKETKMFVSCVKKSYNDKFETEWKDKKSIAVFRGGSTGIGVTVETNPRLKLASISAKNIIDKEDGLRYLDAGITNWNLRPRKIQGVAYLQTIDIKNLPFKLVPKLTPLEQSEYKYIINVDGHVSAFRLSLELNMGSVLLLVDSKWKIWYRELLKPYIHYVPIKADLSNILEIVKWCKKNDKKCEQIAENARIFYEKYLQKDGIFDYMQNIFCKLKKHMNIYVYNKISPLDLQIQEEKKYFEKKGWYPAIDRGITDITSTPGIPRCYSLLKGIEWIFNFIKDKDEFESVATEKENIFTNKKGNIRRFELANFSLAVKTSNNSSKIREHIHESFIGVNSINEISKIIPNFVYVFGYYMKDDTYNVVTEYIKGETLLEYIQSDLFKMDEFIFLFLQISLALQVAQQTCSMVHYDLTPWNILLHRVSTPIEVDYMISFDKIIRIKTNYIPVILDYGKSHVIHKNKHYGFVNMYTTSSIHDIFSLLAHSIGSIIHYKRLNKEDFHSIFLLANFITGTTIREKQFKSSLELKTFFNFIKKYDELLYCDKGNLEDKSPIDFFNFIRFTFSCKSCCVVKSYKPYMKKGNSRQVFEYILSRNTKEQVQTYLDFFKRITQSIPDSNFSFFRYYIIQQIYSEVLSVECEMKCFCANYKISYPGDHKQLIFDKCLSRIQNTKKELVNIKYTTPPFFKCTPELFLEPSNILKHLQNKKYEDITVYKEIIESVLMDTGVFELSSEFRSHYLNMFDKILSINIFNFRSNLANYVTLKEISTKIYKQDQENLSNKKIDNWVQKEYLDVYFHILKH